LRSLAIFLPAFHWLDPAVLFLTVNAHGRHRNWKVTMRASRIAENPPSQRDYAEGHTFQNCVWCSTRSWREDTYLPS